MSTMFSKWLQNILITLLVFSLFRFHLYIIKWDTYIARVFHRNKEFGIWCPHKVLFISSLRNHVPFNVIQSAPSHPLFWFSLSLTTQRCHKDCSKLLRCWNATQATHKTHPTNAIETTSFDGALLKPSSSESTMSSKRPQQFTNSFRFKNIIYPWHTLHYMDSSII